MGITKTKTATQILTAHFNLTQKNNSNKNNNYKNNKQNKENKILVQHFKAIKLKILVQHCKAIKLKILVNKMILNINTLN